jgi:NADH:ubiquinone oxidoreductase subunit 5 (subunit L)/multisubunit Na+/H+ antiporter MnhA subunit
MDIALINFAPFLLAALLTASPLRPFWTRPVRTTATTGLMLLLFAALAGYFPYLQAASPTLGAVTRSMEWVPELGISLSFYVDGLALLFGLIITGIGAGIMLYTGYYFDDDEGQRFTLILLMFAGAMLGVVLAGNLLTLFVMWELTSITSFLLIGFKGKKDAAARAGALQALWITGGGALALILAFVLLGTVSGQMLGTGPIFDLEPILALDPITGHPWYSWIALLLMIGAFTKSAQFPFHFWLPNAMSAPTPASSFLHSATMVKAGIYLLMRLYPVMHGGTAWTLGLVLIGTFTMLLGAYFALGKRDLKGLLAYLTVSTLGAIVALVGLPYYEGMLAAVLMILGHALYKSALFLVVGTIEHNTGTRQIDELGGLLPKMPVLAAVALISTLSMAGLPPLVGFVAKEQLLDAVLHWNAGAQGVILGMMALAAAFTVTASAALFYDVFIRKPAHKLHFHAGSPMLSVTPLVLAVSTVLTTVLIGLKVLIAPLAQQITPRTFYLHLLPSDGLANVPFQISLTAIAAGIGLFLVRDRWRWITQPPLIPGMTWWRGAVKALDVAGDQVVKTQHGQIRYYLFVIFAALTALLLTENLVIPLLASAASIPLGGEVTDVLKAIVMVMGCASALLTAITRNHLTAVLALGTLGYSIGVIFLLEPAPDVAMVQFLVETLTTILIIVILSRISPHQRAEVMKRLWQGRLRFDERPVGFVKDIVIAGLFGFMIFVFTLTVLVNRPEPSRYPFKDFCLLPISRGVVDTSNPGRSISIYHMCNTERDFGYTDIVGAIVAEYRGTDTIVEVMVFSAAVLGVLTMLSRGLNIKVTKPNGETVESTIEEDVQDTTRLSTPFTRFVARLVFVLAFLVALAHLNYGGTGPGDGFTAGALLGLSTALWYVVFGYDEAQKRLAIFTPRRLLRIGLPLILLDALVPVLFGYPFLAHIEIDKLLGIYNFLDIFGLHLNTTVLFEVGVMITVFGGFSAVIQAVAHPQRSAELDHTTPEI